MVGRKLADRSMIAEQKTAQLRVIGRNIIAEGSAGQIFWATPTRARLLIDARAAELVNAYEAPMIGPSETKPMEPAEKKYSAADRDGPSIDSASLILNGEVGQQSSSAADQALAEFKSKPLKRRGRPPKSR